MMCQRFNLFEDAFRLNCRGFLESPGTTPLSGNIQIDLPGPRRNKPKVRVGSPRKRAFVKRANARSHLKWPRHYRIARDSVAKLTRQSGQFRCERLRAAVGRLAWIIPLNTGNRSQVLIDGAKVVVRQFLEIGPRHDLKKVSVHRRVGCIGREAVGSNGSGTVWMKMIEIFAGTQDHHKVFERVIAFREAGFG